MEQRFARGIEGEELTPRTASLPASLGGEHTPVAQVRLDDSGYAALDELERALPATDFTPGLMEALRGIYRPGAGMSRTSDRPQNSSNS